MYLDKAIVKKSKDAILEGNHLHEGKKISCAFIRRRTMEKIQKTTEGKCPYCKSRQVQPLGTSHRIGSGQPMPPTNDSYQYKCSECGKRFHYQKS